MSLVIKYRKVLKDTFSEELYWYMEEFFIFFGKRLTEYDKQDFALTNQLLTSVARLLEIFSDQTCHKEFTLFLQDIETKYPEFF